MIDKQQICKAHIHLYPIAKIIPHSTAIVNFHTFAQVSNNNKILINKLANALAQMIYI